MKKFSTVCKIGDELKELVFFGEKQSDIKKISGFVAIVKEERIQNPKPEIMQRVLISMGVDLASFYKNCEDLSFELEKQEEQKTV